MRNLAVGTALLLGVASAWAGLLPDGGLTAQDVASVLQADGLAVNIDKDRDGDPRVTTTYEGAKFSVYFYNCRGTPRCESIQFTAGFSGTGMTPARVADWNRTKRFGRVYLDRDNDPWVEMDIEVTHGVTTEALASNLNRWKLVLRTFRDYMKGQ